MPDTPSPWSWLSQSGGEHLTGLLVRGRYRFGERIGAGGMADVYAGELLPLGRAVAIKILHVGADEETRRRFRREFKLLATVEHPGLVRALDFDETADGRPFYLMERLRGRSLDRVFEIGERVEPARVVTFGIQICAALHYLHQRGVVHRDIKPGNVFLLEGTDDQIKLIDLGIARFTTGFYEALDEHQRTPTGQREHTQTGIAMGTRGFIPPECGHVKAEPCHDIYSTGVMLYRLLTAKRPSLPYETPTPVTAYVPDVPSSLANAIDRALAEDPKKRFTTTQEFQDALAVQENTARVQGSCTHEDSESPASPVSPASRRSWSWRGPAVSFVCGAVISAALVLSVTKDERHDHQRMEFERGSTSDLSSSRSEAQPPVVAAAVDRTAAREQASSSSRSETRAAAVVAAAGRAAPRERGQSTPANTRAPQEPVASVPVKLERAPARTPRRARVPANFIREMTRVSSRFRGCAASSELTLVVRVVDGVVKLQPSTPLSQTAQRCIDRVAHGLVFGDATFTSTYTIEGMKP
jgi:serine/threonine protein kinase